MIFPLHVCTVYSLFDYEENQTFFTEHRNNVVKNDLHIYSINIFVWREVDILFVSEAKTSQFR